MASTTQPKRMCSICRQRADKRDLLRFAGNEGVLRLDLGGTLAGRGISVHPDASCLSKFMKAFQCSQGENQRSGGGSKRRTRQGFGGCDRVAPSCSDDVERELISFIRHTLVNLRRGRAGQEMRGGRALKKLADARRQRAHLRVTRRELLLVERCSSRQSAADGVRTS